VAYGIWVAVFALIFSTDWLSWQQALRSTTASIPLDGAQRARLRIEHVAGHLQLAAGDDPDLLIDGSFGGGLNEELSRVVDTIDARLSLPGRSGLLNPRYPWSWGPPNLLDWDASLTTRIPLELDIQSAGGQATLDLRGLRVTSVRLKSSASNAEVTLPADAGVTTFRLEASAATTILHVPEGVAASINATRAVSSLEVDIERFPVVVDGKSYRSPGFEEAANRVEIEVELALGWLRVTGMQATPTRSPANRGARSRG